MIVDKVNFAGREYIVIDKFKYVGVSTNLANVCQAVF